MFVAICFLFCGTTVLVWLCHIFVSLPSQDLDFQCHMICHGSFYVQWFEVRGDCLFCWHCWPSLLKLSFHNHSHTNTVVPQNRKQIATNIILIPLLHTKFDIYVFITYIVRGVYLANF
jgi:hypothetical protein